MGIGIQPGGAWEGSAPSLALSLHPTSADPGQEILWNYGRDHELPNGGVLPEVVKEALSLRPPPLELGGDAAADAVLAELNALVMDPAASLAVLDRLQALLAWLSQLAGARLAMRQRIEAAAAAPAPKRQKALPRRATQQELFQEEARAARAAAAGPAPAPPARREPTVRPAPAVPAGGSARATAPGGAAAKPAGATASRRPAAAAPAAAARTALLERAEAACSGGKKGGKEEAVDLLLREMLPPDLGAEAALAALTAYCDAVGSDSIGAVRNAMYKEETGITLGSGKRPPAGALWPGGRQEPPAGYVVVAPGLRSSGAETTIGKLFWLRVGVALARCVCKGNDMAIGRCLSRTGSKILFMCGLYLLELEFTCYYLPRALGFTAHCLLTAYCIPCTIYFAATSRAWQSYCRS